MTKNIKNITQLYLDPNSHKHLKTTYAIQNKIIKLMINTFNLFLLPVIVFIQVYIYQTLIEILLSRDKYRKTKFSVISCPQIVDQLWIPALINNPHPTSTIFDAVKSNKGNKSNKIQQWQGQQLLKLCLVHRLGKWSNNFRIEASLTLEQESTLLQMSALEQSG